MKKKRKNDKFNVWVNMIPECEVSNLAQVLVKISSPLKIEKLFIIIIIIIRRLNARRSPMSHLFLTRRVSQLLGLALVSGAFARIGSIALPFAFHTWCFSFDLIYHWISIVFLLDGRRIATHSVDPSLTHFLSEFPGLGLALVPNAVVPEADSGAHGADNSIQISALAGVEPQTLASSGRGCCH